MARLNAMALAEQVGDAVLRLGDLLGVAACTLMLRSVATPANRFIPVV